MKKIIQVLSLVFLLVLVPVTFCDIGPKPSVNVELINNKSDEVYVTLLGKEESTGPYGVNQALPEFIKEDYPDTWDIVHGRFKEYVDEDGYNYLNYFEKVVDDKYSWTYRAPRDYKILVYDFDSNKLTISKKLDNYAFDSYYTFDLDTLEVHKDYNYLPETINLFIRIILTILIELVIAYFIFKFKSVDLIKVILITNVITQVLLNVGLNIQNYLNGSLAYFFTFYPLELIVFIVEGVVYKMKFKDVSTAKIWTYALSANLASLLVGFWIAKYIPGIM